MSKELVALRDIAAERERRAADELRLKREAFEQANGALLAQRQALEAHRAAIRDNHRELYGGMPGRRLRWYEIETATLKLADMSRAERRIVADIESLEVDVEDAQTELDEAREAFLKAKHKVEKLEHVLDSLAVEHRRAREKREQTLIDEVVSDRALAMRG